MKVEDLAEGQKASSDHDYIVIGPLPSGQFGFSGVVRTGETLAHFSSHQSFPTREEARTAGIEWASEAGATFLQVQQNEDAEDE